MATEAQIEANRRNAQHSTGPRTEAGKANSSRNATKFGLFSTNNCVLPGEEEFYDHFCHTIWDSLVPVGPIEELTAGEYVRASWLLRRCAMAEEREGEYSVRWRAEDNLKYKEDRPAPDPMVRNECHPTAAAIARARAQAFNIQRRALADLLKLQAARRAREAELRTEAERPAPALAPQTDPTEKPTQSAAPPRPRVLNFPCTCGSSKPYDRCCGAVPKNSEPLRPAA